MQCHVSVPMHVQRDYPDHGFDHRALDGRRRGLRHRTVTDCTGTTPTFTAAPTRTATVTTSVLELSAGCASSLASASMCFRSNDLLPGSRVDVEP